MTQCVLRSVMQEKLIQMLVQAISAVLLAIPADFPRFSLGWILLNDTLDEILAADCAVPASLSESKAVISLLLRRLALASLSELALLLHAVEAFQVEGDAELGGEAKQDLAGFLESRLEECVSRCEANAGKSQRMRMILGWMWREGVNCRGERSAGDGRSPDQSVSNRIAAIGRPVPRRASLFPLLPAVALNDFSCGLMEWNEG